jgi:hypothetical protein
MALAKKGPIYSERSWKWTEVLLRMDDTLDLPSAFHNILEELERLDGPAFHLLLALDFPPTFLHSTPKPLPQIPRSKSQHLSRFPSDARSMHIHKLQLLLAFLTCHKARLDPASDVPWDGRRELNKKVDGEADGERPEDGRGPLAHFVVGHQIGDTHDTLRSTRAHQRPCLPRQ